MEGTSSITQKGQVSIPKAIRDHFGLKTFDKLHFSIKDNKIVAEPAFSTDSMFGIIKTQKILTKKQAKKIIRDAVIAKHERNT